MIDGADSNTSLTKRMTLLKREVAAVLGKVGAREYADRRADQHADHGHDDAAVDGIQQPPRRARRRRHCGKQLQRHAGKAARQQCPQNGAQAGKPDERGEQRQAQGRRVARLAHLPSVHTVDSARRSRRSSMKRAAAITVNVMRNSNTPSAINEEV